MFSLTIDTGNAAFSEDRNAEVARILEETASKLRDGRCQDASDELFLRDLNGNKVGKAFQDTDMDDEHGEA